MPYSAVMYTAVSAAPSDYILACHVTSCSSEMVCCWMWFQKTHKAELV